MEVLEQCLTSALQRHQGRRGAEMRRTRGETQILTKPGSAELCIWGREEKRLRYTKTLKTAAGALQAPEFHHH